MYIQGLAPAMVSIVSRINKTLQKLEKEDTIYLI